MLLFRGLEVFFVAMFFVRGWKPEGLFLCSFGFIPKVLRKAIAQVELYLSSASIICDLLSRHVAVRGWSTDGSFLGNTRFS